ncbi:putative GTPase activating protein for Arf-domain-containing protein, partial [Mycena metata]
WPTNSLNKITIERNQRILLDLVAQPGNCRSRTLDGHPTVLGIFICVSCASVHRKIGTHVTKVKSLTMDSWTREQTENMKQNGNIKSNLYYNPNEARHPPPPNLMDGERDSEMEQFIRSKYEYKSFLDRSAVVASKLGPSRSASAVASRATPSPSTNGNSNTSAASKPPSAPTVRSAEPKTPPPRSFSQPVPLPPPQQTPQRQPPPPPAGGVWNDLISLQAPASSSTLPLQLQASPAPLQGYGQQPMTMNTGYQPRMQMGSMAANPYQSQFTPPAAYSAPIQQTQFTPSFSSPSFGGGGGGAPLYNPQPQPFAPQQQQMFQGQPLPSHSPMLQQQQGSPAPQNFGYQQPPQSMTPTYGNQMLGGNHRGSCRAAPQPQLQFQPGQQGQFMGSSPQPGFQQMAQPPFQQSPQPPFQQQQYGMQQQQGQQWMGAGGPGYFPQQQQQGQWGGM